MCSLIKPPPEKNQKPRSRRNGTKKRALAQKISEKKRSKGKKANAKDCQRAREA
jgi:hypothetical protein